jgi:3-dehydroquinate synthase
VLERNGLPTQTVYTADQLTAAALSDKKRTGGTLTLVLPERVGACRLHPVEVEKLEKLIALALEG